VGWHQDRTIAVKERVETPGFGPWSMKAGTPHVEPPQSLLEQMFTLRLHLDDCGKDNGPLKVVPGSHKLGRLGAREVVELAGRSDMASCTVAAEDVVAMKGLMLHASEPAAAPGHRRVLHLDFSTAELPEGLRWAVGE
jgi:ectoine hydroxylase-related dioxygenase (phytanoyl-CoA dioxygenase family)